MESAFLLVRLPVLKFVDEPTAAALANGLDKIGKMYIFIFFFNFVYFLFSIAVYNLGGAVLMFPFLRDLMDILRSNLLKPILFLVVKISTTQLSTILLMNFNVIMELI